MRKKIAISYKMAIILACFSLFIFSIKSMSTSEQIDEATFNPNSNIYNFLRSPVRIAVDADGKVYITDFKKRCVAIFKKGKKLTKTIQINGRPLAVAIDSKGWIYVGNDSTDNVEVYDPFGTFKYNLGHTNGQIRKPNDIAIDSSTGRIYVVDSDENIIRIYNSDGTFYSSFGGTGTGDGQFRFPTGIAIDENNAEIIIGDFLNKRVQIFNAFGYWLSTIGGKKSQLSRPQGIMVDDEGRIYVVDSLQAKVLVFNRFGKLLKTFGEYGEKHGQLRLPLDIAFNRQGHILVTSNRNSRVEMFVKKAIF